MFAPAPVVDRINAERLLLFGWSRAILLQLAHPLVAAGVAQSSFRDSPAASARRLHHTVRAMLALTFGDERARGQALANIRAIHRRINGTLDRAVGLFPAGTAYSAEDPALLLWVHATLIESTILVYEALVTELEPADRDLYCRASADVAIALGARDEEVPRDWAALNRYLRDVHASGTLAVGPAAREIARALLYGRFSRIVGPVAWVNQWLTLGWLPAPIRDQYGFAWTSRDARAFARTQRILRRSRRLLPRAIALWPEARRLPRV